MRRIHIVGRRNHGKTTLIVELIGELRRRGLRVGTVKHSCHRHDLDSPGKDSYRHRQAGGQPAAIVTQDLVGVFLPRPSTCVYARLQPLFADCQLVVVEGDIESRAVKVEVWRAAVGGTPLAAERTDIAAVVSDDPLAIDLPVCPRGDPAQLADLVCTLVDLPTCIDNAQGRDHTAPFPKASANG